MLYVPFFVNLKIEMRGRESPTGRAKFVNRKISLKKQEHVYKIIFVFDEFWGYNLYLFL